MLPAATGTDYALGGSVRLSTPARVFLSRTCEFFPAAVEVLPLRDTAGTWVRVESAVTAPDGAASVLCSFDLTAPEKDDFDASPASRSTLSIRRRGCQARAISWWE